MTSETIEIRELNNEQEWLDAFPVMKQLRMHLDENQYLDLVKDAVVNENYQMVALFSNKKIVAVTGFMPMTTLYNGRFIWICDLVTDSNQQSKGYGETLLKYVEDWSKEKGYTIVSLSSGLHRLDAHRFYEDKMEYDKVSYVFLKDFN